MTREYWRGILEWQNDKIHLSTPSNEAAKLYDASLTQFVGWYDDANLGGLDGTIKKMLEADPYFVMGHCLSVGLRLASTGETIRRDKELKACVENLKALKTKQVITDQEMKHIDAVIHWSNGDALAAALKWEDILIDCPMDIHALRMAHDAYFYLGLQAEMRDSIARVMPFWQSVSIPLKSYLHGMYAFGLVETNFFSKAEMEAKKGLEKNKNDAWSTHSLAHVYEMQGEFSKGEKFLLTTENDWNVCNHLSIHNYWHLALYHIEQSDYSSAYSILDNYVLKRNNPSILDIVDTTSLLYRIELSENNLNCKAENTERWKKIYQICHPHLSDHITVFNDAHYLMSILGVKSFDEAEELLNYYSEIEFSTNQKEESTSSTNNDKFEMNFNKNVLGKSLALPLIKAMIAYEREKFDQAVELLMPVRYKLINIGGSNAQRDVFNQLLLISAIKSTNEKHRKLAEHLLIERESLRLSPLTERLILSLNSV